MKIKKFLVLLCCLVLVGCQSASTPQSDPQKGLYDGLDAKETYTNAVQYFNEHVTYYDKEVTDSLSDSIYEYYSDNGKIAVVTKAQYFDGGNSFLNYNIITGSEFHSLYMNDEGLYEYEVMDDYAQSEQQMLVDMTQSSQYEILEIERKDTDEGIILTMKVKNTEDEEEANYYISELKINKQGYICEEKNLYYDEDFNEVLSEETLSVYGHFNEKNIEGLQEEIELMKSCEGLSDEDVYQQLGIEKSL